MLALLRGAGESSTDYKDKIMRSGLAVAALTLNDRNKTPLDCACERIIAFSVHGKEPSLRKGTVDTFRSVRIEDDPFADSGIGLVQGSTRRSFANRNINRSQRRSQLSTSFILSAGMFGGNNDSNNDNTLRTSCTFLRRPIHPIFGLERLDEEGDEELTKCELLARAVCGNYSTENCNSFLFVHAATKLCQPEVVWHAARKYPSHVMMNDEFGRVPLFLACERLVTAVLFKTAPKTPTSVDFLDLTDNGSAFVAASLPKYPATNSLSASATEEIIAYHHSAPSTGIGNPRNQQSSKVTPNTSFLTAQDQMKSAVEIADMLLYSSAFGNKHMAAIPNNKGRLPLHVVLEAVPWTDHNDTEVNTHDSKAAAGHPHIIKSLIDANPLALETKDCTTGFYPFMIAAVAPERKLTSDNDANEEMYLSSVETVFRLLLECPTVISLYL